MWVASPSAKTRGRPNTIRWVFGFASTQPPGCHMNFTHVRLGILILAGLVAGAMTALAVSPQARQRLFPNSHVTTSGEAQIGAPFALTDHTGRRVTDADFRGRIMLILFGSTASPDATPSALQVVAAALDKLGPRADRF